MEPKVVDLKDKVYQIMLHYAPHWFEYTYSNMAERLLQIKDHETLDDIEFQISSLQNDRGGSDYVNECKAIIRLAFMKQIQE